MGRIDLALAAVIAVTSAAPAVAADQAQGRPPQLTQTSEPAKTKDKAAARKKDSTRANKGGAARGDARSDQVHDMNKAK